LVNFIFLKQTNLKKLSGVWHLYEQSTRNKPSQANVAHTCNPSCSGGRDQEDHSSKFAQASSSPDPTSKKNPSKKMAGGMAQGVGPEFKSQYCKKKNKTKKPK
jgi:hypothetical protein